MDFVLVQPDILPSHSGGRGGKRGKDMFLDRQRAWRLVVENCNRIGAYDSFVSVFERVRKFGPFYMEEWDTLWQNIAADDRFDSLFRQRINARLALGPEKVRRGDLSETEPIDWTWPVGTHSSVLHFLRDSDIMRCHGKVRWLMNFDSAVTDIDNLNLDPLCVCLSQEQFNLFSKFDTELISDIDLVLRGVDMKSELLLALVKIDAKMKKLGIWTEAGTDDLLRMLKLDTGKNWPELVLCVDGSLDGCVLLDLPRQDTMFAASYAEVMEMVSGRDMIGISVASTILGSLQLAILREGNSAILCGFDDARSWKCSDQVHLSLNRRRARGDFFTKEGRQWDEYRLGYELVRPMPTCEGKTLIVKPFEWAAVCLMVSGMDTLVQGLLVEQLASKKKHIRLETILGKMCNIDMMVLHVRKWIKTKPLLLRLWPIALDAGEPVWRENFQHLSGMDLEAIGWMLEIKIFAAGQMHAQAQRTLDMLLKIAIVEMDDPFLNPANGIVPSLYNRLRPVHKRTRKELEEFLAFSVKKLRGWEDEDDCIGDLARRARELV